MGTIAVIVLCVIAFVAFGAAVSYSGRPPRCPGCKHDPHNYGACRGLQIGRVDGVKWWTPCECQHIAFPCELEGPP